MGWSGGSGLMGMVITAARRHILNDDDRYSFYQWVIPDFENYDWDTQNECMGDDPMFDKALKSLHPDWYREEE